MTKVQFILSLKDKLHGLPAEDAEKVIQYYSEMIDDRMEDGLSEEEAVAAVGSVDEIAQQILEYTPMPKLLKAKLCAKKLETWQIVLLVISAPIWLSIAVSLFSGLFSLYTGIWVAIITLFAIGGALVGCAVGGALAAIVFCFTGHPASALFILGCGLICGGVGLFLILGGKHATKGTIWISKKLWLWIKSLFVRKETVQ